MMARILNGYAIYGDYDYQSIMVIEIELKQSIVKESMEQAFRAALEKASLFNVKLAWKNNCLQFEKNNSIFALSEKDKMTLGEDNGGFLFTACAADEVLTIAIAHALADGVVLFPFIRLVLMNYFQLLGLCNFEKQIENLGLRLSGENTGEDMLLEKLQGITANDQPIEKRFQFWSLADNCEQEYKVVTLGLDLKKTSTSPISQVAEMMKKNIDKVNIESTPVSCGLIYDMRSRLKLTEPMHECYSFLSIPFESGEFENNWKRLDEQEIIFENMSRELPVWQKMASEDMPPGVKKRLCNKIARKQKQYQDTFYLSNIAFTNKLDRLNNYIECISTYSLGSRQDMLVEMHQLGEIINLSITYIDTADRVVAAFIDEMRQRDIITFEKSIAPKRVEFILSN